MDETREALEKGIRKVYNGQIVMLISTFAAILGVLMMLIILPLGAIFALPAAIGIIVGWVVWMLGINDCKKADSAYDRAFDMVVCGIVIAVVGGLFGGVAEAVLSVLSTVLSTAVIYYFVRATRPHLTDEMLVQRGERAVTISVVTAGIDILITIIGQALPLLPMPVLLAAMVVGLLQIYYFITYLKGAVEALRA